MTSDDLASQDIAANTSCEHAEPEGSDPVAILLSDPESHYSDILYFNFRIYKKRVLWRFLQLALAELKPAPEDSIRFTDVGASFGHDVLYLVRKLTNNFRAPLPFSSLVCSMIEGSAELIKVAMQSFKTALKSEAIEILYHHHPLVEGIPLPEASQDVVLCSEIVEHLESPDKVIRECYRILKPGGFLLLTTDNSPSALQYLRRLPVLLTGKYHQVYARPSKESETVGITEWNGRSYPIYGHINLNPTSFWEKLCREAGFTLYSYGTYESIRRGGGTQSPLILSIYFGIAMLVYYLLPPSLGRFFGDTTALLLRKPN
jgi:SAM-dependent methyltransferase